MAQNFWETVNWIIKESDILVIVLDARFVDDTMNEELMGKARKEKKPCLFAVTKADLAIKVNKDALPRPFVIVSPRYRRGKSALRDRILAMAEQNYGKDSSVRVGVLGYPNVGKSSVINMLKGTKSAPTGGLPGKTRGEQWIRAHKRILLMDTPGVIPYKEKDIVKHTVTGVIDPSRLKDPVQVLKGISEKYPGVIEKYFGVAIAKPPAGEKAAEGEAPAEPEADEESIAERIARKKNLLKKGGVPDCERAARMAIAALQKGKIRM